MVNKLTVINYHPGADRFTFLKDKVLNNHNNVSGQVLLLSPERVLSSYKSRNMIENCKFDTFFYFCFSLLQSNNKLTSYLFDYADKKDKTYYKHFYHSILRLSNQEILKSLNGIETIVVDFYQNYNITQILIIRKLVTVYDCDLVLMGDETQVNYSFLNRLSRKSIISNNFRRINQYFTYKEIDYFTLNQNNFLSTQMIQFMNAYYKFLNHHSYSNAMEGISTDFPKLIFLQNFTEIVEEICKSFDKDYKNKSMIIVVRYKKEKIILKRLIPDTYKAKVSIYTIYEAQCSTFSSIIYVGFSKDMMNKENAGILSTILSLATQKLTIISSCRDTGFYRDIFPEHLLSTKNNQKHRKVFHKFKELKDNRNTTVSKLVQHNIDSISFGVKLIYIPFFTRVVNEKKYSNTKDNFACSIESRTYNGFHYQIKYHNSSGSFIFEFYDLKLLQNNSYGDKNIINFCHLLVQEYFDFRVNPDFIELKRIDLQKVFRFSNKNEEEVFLKNLVSIGNKQNLCVLNDKGMHVKCTDRGIMDRTIYINMHKRKSNSLTLRMYDIGNKNNKNIVFIENTLKLEITLKGNVIGNEYALGAYNNISSILLNKKNELYELLNDVYARCMVKIFGEKVGGEIIDKMVRNTE